MAIGVPKTDVFQAADRVLARGERPTVERVRAQLGRGSPARVGQLLEQWWEALAKRLAGETRLPELPADVAAAFRSVWATATEHATAVADAALAERRESVERDHVSLSAERLRLNAEIDGVREALRVADAARTVADQRLADQLELVDQLRRELDDGAHRRDALEARNASLEQELAALRRQVQHKEDGIAKERAATAEHVRSVEDRAHAEVDRARADAKAQKAQIAQLEREGRTLRATLSEEHQAHANALRAAERVQAAAEAKAATMERQFALLIARPPRLSARRKKTSTGATSSRQTRSRRT